MTASSAISTQGEWDRDVCEPHHVDDTVEAVGHEGVVRAVELSEDDVVPGTGGQ